MASKKIEKSAPPVIRNKRSGYDYELSGFQEAGIVLVGSEVKSILKGKANFSGAFCRIKNGEIWLEDMDIAPYEMASAFTPERKRPRKLLMHKREIELIRRKSEEKGLTIIPTKIYFKNGKVKVEIAIAKKKKRFDKREKLIERHSEREKRLK